MTRFRRGNIKTGGDSGTVNVQIAVGGDDTWRASASLWSNSGASVWGPGKHPTHDPGYYLSFRFTGITVPQGATIDSATFEPWCRIIGNDGDQKTNIYAEDADDPAAPTSYGDFDGRAMTTAFTAWDDVDYAEGFIESPSIVDVIKELVDRGTWVDGDALQIFWRDDTSLDDDYVYTRMYEDTSGGSAGDRAAKLNIEWST